MRSKLKFALVAALALGLSSAAMARPLHVAPFNAGWSTGNTAYSAPGP
jgi:hypothetical protein